MFTIEDLMAYFMPLMSGDYTTDNRALTLQDKQYTNANDLLKMMFSPMFGMMTGTFDPMLAAPAQPEPVTPFTEQWGVTQQYAASTNPDVSYVANGIMSGQLDGLTARQYLNNAMSTSLTGVTPEQIESMVSAMEKEAADNTNRYAQYQADVAQSEAVAAAAPRTDPFAEYGLPSPLELYTAESVPMDQSYYQRVDSNAQALANAENALSQANRTANAADVTRMADDDRARTTADNRNRRNEGRFNSQLDFDKRYLDWSQEKVRMNELADKNQGRVDQRVVDAQRGAAGSMPTLSGGNDLADMLATRVYLKLKDEGKVDTTKPKKVEPKLTPRPKKTEDQIRAGSMAATAKSEQASLQGQASGAAWLANKQGRSPLMDAMMQRFMAMSPGGVG